RFPLAKIEGLAAWWKAETLRPTHQDFQKIQYWADTTPTRRTLMQNDESLRPTFHSGVIHGKSVVRFNGSQRFAPHPSLCKNSFTLFIVARPQATHEIDPMSHQGAAGLSGQNYLLFPPHAGPLAGAGLSWGTNGVSIYEHGDDYLPAVLVSALDRGERF